MTSTRAAGGVRWPAAVAAGLGALTLAGYVALLLAEGDSPFRPRPLVFVLGIVVATVTAAVGAAAAPRVARPALAVAAAVFGAVGLLGIFSIGLPLLAAAVLAGVAAGRTA